MNQRKILASLAGLSLMLSASTAYAQLPPDRTSPTREFQPIEQPITVKVGVAIAGATLIGLELWWFLLSKPQQ